MEKRYLAMWMWLCEGKFKVKILSSLPVAVRISKKLKLRNMKMSDNPTKYEVLIKQYLRSILDISDISWLRRLIYVVNH